MSHRISPRVYELIQSSKFKHAMQILGSARPAPDDHGLTRDDDVQLVAPSALPGRPGQQPVGGEQPLGVAARGRHPPVADIPQPGMMGPSV